jgi:hypothetical protein
MKTLIVKYFLVAIFLLTPFAVQAEDRLLELWPNQRAKHIIKSQEDAARYEARAHDYVAHTYATGGEVPIEPADDFMADGQPEIDPVPVDVNQISQIVEKTEGSVIEDPSKSPAVAQ